MNHVGFRQFNVLIEFPVSLQEVDAGMNYDSPDPALERAFILKSMYVGKNLDKRLLEHVFRIFPTGRKAVADAEHFGTVLVVQFPLRRSIIF